MRHLFGDNTKKSENTTSDKMEILTKLIRIKQLIQNTHFRVLSPDWWKRMRYQIRLMFGHKTKQGGVRITNA